jgi:hypothetical protein
MSEAKPRERKSTDQENAQRAYEILYEAIKSHPEIEGTIWSSACFTLIVDGYLNCEIPFEHFSRDMDAVKQHYKSEWEQEK